MATKEVIVQELLEWASSQGTSLHPSLEIYQDDVTGLSFKAKDAITTPGTRLVSCSYQTTLSYLNATPVSTFPFQPHGSQLFPPEFLITLNKEDSHVIGHFFLMQQYLMGDKSFWWKYIRLLPQPDQRDLLAIPIWWNEADRRFLHGTNAQPPIDIREALWTEEYTKAIKLLEPEFTNWKAYSKKLYFWAATIFGTRSFRASLTIPEEVLPVDFREELWDRVAEDRFSVLLPVLDIGNHNGVNRVEWTKHPEDGYFALSTCKAVEKGEQIYNFYGDKSNSELLVGYGFTLNSSWQDVANLKLVPTRLVRDLRRNQMCHEHPESGRKKEEFMFGIRRSSLAEFEEGSLGLKVLPHGLLETLICMVANDRERKFIEKNPQYCLQMDLESGSFPGPLYRALFSAIRILYIKIRLEIQRLHDTGEGLSAPQNCNQTMALKYRASQNAVLDEAQTCLLRILEDALVFKSFDSPEIFKNEQDFPAGLLTLKHAFSWLEVQYTAIHESVALIISADQEEELPLKWHCLVIDWDHTYWCVWIYIVLSLLIRDGNDFLKRHPSFGAWLKEIGNYSEVEATFHASASEEDTINLTIQAIYYLPCFKEEGRGWEGLRNLASFIAKEESVTVACDGGVTQQVLAISEKGLKLAKCEEKVVTS